MTPSLSARITEYRGKPTLFINDQPANPIIYALTDVPAGRWSWEENPQYNIRLFIQAGIKLFQIDLFLDHIWFSDGRFDIEMARKQIRGVLEACPEAAIMIRFHVNAPKWWRDAHPEEWVRYADLEVVPDDEWGLRRIIEYDVPPTNRVSLASQKWLAAVTPKLVEFLRLLAETPEGDHLISIQVACGVYGEWHYFGFFHAEPDTGPAMTAYFRNWLREKYGTDQVLQNAWRQKQATLDTAQVHNLEQRLQPKAGVFRDPQLEQDVIDYYECQHQVVADDIIHFCRVVKESWPRSLVTAAFYGYFYALFGRHAAGGHLALERVINSEYVDCMCAPQAYYPHSVEPGMAYRSRSLIETLRLHNKLWLDEMDNKPDIHWDIENSTLSTAPEIVVDAAGWEPSRFQIGDKPLDPLFYVNDPKATTLGHLAGTDLVAFARKILPESTAWYCSLPINQVNLLRCILREAGAHIYADQGDVFYASRGILAVHTKDGGKRVITLKNGKQVEFEMVPFSTTFLDSENGNILL